MKNLFKSTLMAFATVVMLSACSDNEGGVSDPIYYEKTQVLSNYVEEVVVSRYETLAEAVKTLKTKVAAISTDGSSDATAMEEAAEAWKSARYAWERTEAYLFGPVDNIGIDPGIDSWPLSLVDLASMIKNWTGDATDIATLRNDEGDHKGFHAVEFLLFKEGGYKDNINDFASGSYGTGLGFGSGVDGAPSASSLQQYLSDVTDEIYRCVLILVAEWDYSVASTNSSIKDDLATYIQNGDIALQTASSYSQGKYGEIFITAGQSGNNVFKSQQAALSQIVSSAYGISEEVGSTKIADPINDLDVMQVESWFSYNSVTDFTNNIIGIKEAYMGKLYSILTNISTQSSVVTDILADNTFASSSLADYVNDADATLHSEILAAIDDCIEKVAAMPAPFRDNLSWNSANTAAATACADLTEVLEGAESKIKNYSLDINLTLEE